MTPEQKVGQLMKIVLTVVLLILFIILQDEDEFGSRTVINFILNGNWKRGLNELSLAAIVCCLVSLLALILFKDLLVRLLSSMLNAKGKTIIGLVSSLIQYVAILTALFYCLAYLGFDTSVLITSASILTLAISLGSKDLVADILSGIFIIFEGDFHIGDIIEVNGFKGKVVDIGVRSTKLKDGNNNIKIIDNQSVKNVLNMSRETSWIFINLTISNSQPLDEIEAMLDRELPEIGKQNPDVINGPFYFGISEIGYHWTKICVAAVCQQVKMNKLKSDLNHNLFDLFNKNGFKL
jgi:small conductance mechanosensitive channel